MPERTVIIGVDIGQQHDPTAIAVVEIEFRPDPTGKAEDPHHLVRLLERLPLGTPYPEVAARVVAVQDGLAARGASPWRTYIDATGVGKPIVDLIEAAGDRRHGSLSPVYFTHGDRFTKNEDRSYTLGKAYLVSRLQVLMQSGQLHFPPDLVDRDALTRELLDYEIRISADANDTYGAFKVGAHDDMVTAVGLACVDDHGRRYMRGRLTGPFAGGRPELAGIRDMEF